MGAGREVDSEACFQGVCEQTPSPFTSRIALPTRSLTGDHTSLFGSGLKHNLAGAQLAPAQARMRACPSRPHFQQVTGLCCHLETFERAVSFRR